MRNAFYNLRTRAGERHCRSLNGRSPGRDFLALPARCWRFHILSLHALDVGQRDGRYRTFADVVLGFRGTKENC